MLRTNKKTLVYIFPLIVSVFFSCSYSLANPFKNEKAPQITDNKKAEGVGTDTHKNNKKFDIAKQTSITWTETLSLQDFFLLPDYTEIRPKLKEYRIALYRTYNETPSVFSTAINYGLLLIDIGEFEKAQLVWNRALKDFSSNEAPRAYKAWLDAKMGNYEEAKNEWYPIAKQKVDNGIVEAQAGLWLPYHIDSIVGLYLIKDRLPENERQEVANVVDPIIGAFSQNPRFAAVLINEYLKSGELSKAGEALAKVLVNNPDDPVLITLLGIAQLMTNQYEEALKLFDRAKEINPDIPTNHIMRARALFALNKEKESFEELDEAMKLNPDLSISENKKKKYLAAKSYLVSKKLKKDKEI